MDPQMKKVKLAMHIHRMLHAEIPDDATGVYVCNVFVPFLLLTAPKCLECSQATYTTTLGIN